MLIVYRLFLVLYYLAAWLSSAFHAKARSWIKGRKQSLAIIRSRRISTKPLLWMHASSLGEFEQGRPVLELFRQQHPAYQIMLSFYSPSGYEVRKNYEHADMVCYLPHDGPANARKFISAAKPDLVIFVKYDFWYYYFTALGRQDIPLFLVSAVFRKNQLFFRPGFAFMRKSLLAVTHFFVQDENSKQILSTQGFHNISIIPDTRTDRVMQIFEHAKEKEIEHLVKFKGNNALLVLGSSYETEESFVKKLLDEGQLNGKVLIVPHQLSATHLAGIQSTFGSDVLFWTKITSNEDLANSPVMVLDTIGMLSTAYKYADMVFIGGGFNKSIHNTLEPAVYGVPVIFGPKGHEKFREAVEMIRSGGACLVTNYEEFKSQYKRLLNVENKRAAGSKCREFIENNLGGTKTVVDTINQIMSQRS